MTETELLTQRVEELERIIHDLVLSDRYMFQKNLQYMDGRNIQLGIGTGTKIGTAGTQKMGFYGATPIIRPTGVAVSAGGVHAALVSLGLITA